MHDRYETKKIKLDDLYLDPNNPRLGEVGCGYRDEKLLFDEATQERLINKIETEKQHDFDDLKNTILKKGWYPVDSIWVWEHPNAKGKYVVVEGNRRTTALKIICGPSLMVAERTLKNAEAKESINLDKFKEEFSEHQRIEQFAKVDGIPVNIMNVDADNLDSELIQLLSVRHINTAKPWPNDARDSYLFRRYKDIHRSVSPNEPITSWNKDICKKLAREASLTEVKTEQKLRAISWFEDFKIDYESKLPLLDNGNQDQFKDTDYYLFELTATNTVFRDTILKVSKDDLVLSDNAKEAIFQWVFAKPSHFQDSRNNTNKFYAHRNILNLTEMKKFDDKHGTSFASSYDVDEPGLAEPMSQLYDIKFKGHQLTSNKTKVLASIIEQLKKLNWEEMEEEGESLKRHLNELHDRSGKILKGMESYNA